MARAVVAINARYITTMAVVRIFQRGQKPIPRAVRVAVVPHRPARALGAINVRRLTPMDAVIRLRGQKLITRAARCAAITQRMVSAMTALGVMEFSETDAEIIYEM